METYLLGYGFAVVIALISWSDRIKDLQSETHEVEEEFAQAKEVNFRKIRIILSQQKGISLNKRIKSLTSFINKADSESDIENTLTIINKFRELFDQRAKIERCLQIKFMLIVYLAFFFIMTGVIACFISNENFISIGKQKVILESIFIAPLVPYFIFLLFYLLFLNRKELSYRRKLSETLELF